MRTVNQGFEEFLSRLTPTLTQRVAGAGHRASVKAALEASLPVNRFFESGSFSHGTGVRHHSDIDVFVTLKDSRPAFSYEALTRVETILRNRFPTTFISIDRPAVVVRFGGGFETWEIIPAYIAAQGRNGELIYDIPGPQIGAGWIRSAPDDHLRYVDASNQTPRYGCAKALARLLKAWKYFCDVPISSFYLEMRAARHVAAQTIYIHIYDLCYLLEQLYRDSLAPMTDPAGLTSDICACATKSDYATARARLLHASTYARLALEAYRSNDEASAFDYLSTLFGGRFPSRYG